MEEKQKHEPGDLWRAFLSRYINLKKRAVTLNLIPPAQEELWGKLLARYNEGFRCFYCIEKMKIAQSSPSPNVFSFDRFEPYALGGDNHLDNIVICCNMCNLVKSTTRGGTWLRIVELIPDRLRMTWYLELRQGAMANKLDRLRNEKEGI